MVRVACLEQTEAFKEDRHQDWKRFGVTSKSTPGLEQTLRLINLTWRIIFCSLFMAKISYRPQAFL
jgi:hypothetical protein